MATPVNMPQVGQDIEKAIITEWCVKENDTVEKGDIIAVVDSDKASFEVEAFESGTILKLLYEEGETAKVFKPIAYLGKPGEILKEGDFSTVRNPQEQSGKMIESGTQPEKTDIFHNKKILATPAVKRVAKENKINLSTIKGSGPNGRILKKDVFNEVNRLNETQIIKPAGDNLNDSIEKDPGRISFSKMRQKIADRLVESKQQAPHFYLFMDIDVTDVLVWRKRKNETNDSDLKISINDILILSVTKALKKYPMMNIHVSQTYISPQKDINIGIAVSLEDGLIVPVVEKADKKDIEEISKESKELVHKARNGLMKPSAPGTFTISNLGMYSVDKFIPIINAPEGAILGVGMPVKKVIPIDSEKTKVRDMLTLTLASDHRAIDGAMAAQFLEEIKQILEKPDI